MDSMRLYKKILRTSKDCGEILAGQFARCSINNNQGSYHYLHEEDDSHYINTLCSLQNILYLRAVHQTHRHLHLIGITIPS